MRRHRGSQPQTNKSNVTIPSGGITDWGKNRTERCKADRCVVLLKRSDIVAPLAHVYVVDITVAGRDHVCNKLLPTVSAEFRTRQGEISILDL